MPASKYVRMTATGAVTTGPGSVEKIVVGSHNASTFRLWDGTDQATTPITGTYTPATGSSVILLEAVFNTALYVSATSSGTNTIDYTFLINGTTPR